jgi:hypothetical protein
VGIRCADRATSSTREKLALTSPTSGGRSVGIVRLRTKATEFSFFRYSGGGVQLVPLGTEATNRPIVPAPDDYDDEEIGGMMISRGNRSTRRKPTQLPLCPPQTPHAARTRTRAVAVGSQRLTA